MNPTREEALFALALEKPAQKRVAILDAACEGDAALRARLEALLAAHDQPDELLASPANIGPGGTVKVEIADEPADGAVGEKIGRYKILEKVGEGGCGVIAVHDPLTGEHVRSLAGPGWHVGALAFSPDDQLLAAGSWDARIYLWNVSIRPTRGSPVGAPWRGHRRGVATLDFSPDQRTLISSSDDYTVRLWNVQTGQELLLFERRDYAFLSENGGDFALRDIEGTLHLHRLPTHPEAEARNSGMLQLLNLDRFQTAAP